MTRSAGNQTQAEALANLIDMTGEVKPFEKSDFENRIQQLQSSMKQSGAVATYLHAGTNLYYFTGLQWSPSERMVAAIVPADGEICYIAPYFELDTLRDYWEIEAPIHGWQEHEDPFDLLGNVLSKWQLDSGRVLIDEVTPYFIASRISEANPSFEFELAQEVTQALRARKSDQEIATIKRAHEMTLEVIKSAASILKPGIVTTQVVEFIDQAHRAVGASAGSYFCIVLFGVATSFPHGVKDPQALAADDCVLIDTGCELLGYKSDITRSFCFGEPSDEYRAGWAAEKSAQLAAFAAASIGSPCEAADFAARESLVSSGFGPDYQLPGLPHRTGHGCGLDIHEAPNLVRGEKTALAKGMVFSNEPMLVVPDEFGIRLEDHFYMNDQGPVWFTQPSHSVDDPFGKDQ
jgi:Xaa-Pro dipeptidase